MKPPVPPEPKQDDTAERAAAFARPAAFLASSIFNWMMSLFAAIVLAAGGLFLTVAWQIGPQVALRASDYAKYTGRADARIVESWLALEIDIPTIRIPENWRASARASPCVVVDLEGDWGAARRRAFCGNRLGFSESYEVVFLNKLAPRVPFAWSRDERGFAVPEMRLTPAAHEWLASHPTNTFMHREWPAKSALEWLKVELDRPIDAALAGWSAPAPTLTVVYDPQQPSVLIPKGMVESRLAHPPAWVMAVIMGILGLAIWFGGMWLLPGMQNYSAPGRIIITVLPLFALPWFASHFPEAMHAFNATLGEVVSDVFKDLDPLDRFAATDPDDAMLARGERLVWRAGDGPYAETFGRLRFVPPSPAPASNDAALIALAQGATAHLRTLDDEERAAFFDRLARDKRLDLRAAGLVAVPGAREALLEAGTDPRVLRAASGFLWEWVTQPIETPNPHLPAYRTRVELTASLADVPVPEIANMARRR